MNAETARAELQTRLSKLLTRQGQLATHLHHDDGRLEVDPEDRASIVGMDEVVEDIDEAGRAEITAIRAALQRLDDGTWGTCARCGEPIAPRRLDAIPEAADCVRCAS